MIPAMSAETTKVAASNDGRHIVVGDRQVQWFDGQTGRLRAVLPCSEPIQTLALAGDNQTLLTLDDSRAVRIWSLPSGWLPNGTLPGPGITRTIWSPDSKLGLAITSHQNGQIKLWDSTKPEAPVVTLATTGKSPRAAAFSADSKLILIGSAVGGKGDVQLYEAQGKIHGPPWLHEEPVTAVCFRPDGQTVFTGTEGGKVIQWDVAKGRTIGQPFAFNKPILALALDASRNIVAVSYGGKDNKSAIEFRSLEKNAAIGKTLMQDAVVVDVQFEADGRIVRTVDNKNVVHRWDIEIGQSLMPANAPPDAKLLALNASGQGAVYREHSEQVRCVMPTSPAPFLIQCSGGARFQAAAFSPDGQILLTAWTDGLRLWDTSTGQRIGPVLQVIDARFVSWAPSGRQFMAWNETEARFWNIPSAAANGDDPALWLQTHLGVERNAEGGIHWLSAPEWHEKIKAAYRQ
jgi:WD40 repeat protein